MLERFEATGKQKPPTFNRERLFSVTGLGFENLKGLEKGFLFKIKNHIGDDDVNRRCLQRIQNELVKYH